MGLLLVVPAVGAAALPAGTLLEVRLRTPVSSYSSAAGTPVEATLLAPVRHEGKTIMPLGTLVQGHLEEVRKVGIGLKNGTAALKFKFDFFTLPNGDIYHVPTRLIRVDNGRESVDEQGRVKGIRPTAAMGHRLAGIARNIFIWDPMIQGIIIVATAATLNFPEAEINFAAGTEFVLALAEPLEIGAPWATELPHLASNREQQERLDRLVAAITPRTYTTGDKQQRPADLINVVLLGDPEWVARAFGAAGWVQPDPLSVSSGWMAFRAVAENSPYPNAPMGRFTLDEQPPQFQYSKSLNNYSKRHHLRVFKVEEGWNGRAVFAAAATHDVAITMEFKSRRITHKIDPNIDNERAKVINDLVYTGCVDAAALVPRASLPGNLANSNGDPIVSDGSVAVLELNPCRTPRAVEADDTPAPKPHGNKFARGTRQFFLTVRQDFTYNNPFVQIWEGIKFLGRRGKNQEDRLQPERTSPIEAPLRATSIAPAPAGLQ